MHNACMPLIQIRDVPEAVRDELARKAAAAGQSMQAYLLGELTKLAERPSMAEIVRRAETWSKVFDGNSLVALRKASVRFDAEKDLGKMKAKVLYVLSRTDKLFPPSIAPDVMAKLKAAGVTADYFEIDSDFGHSASGLDAAKWAPRLRTFMAGLEKRS